ncbi:MAG: HDOD domain-containing protein [Acidobacteriota bacterium]|nr:HDOD domain-containing protein [Acidobacteriota bacterium]MDQ7086648.1 HDOD domain-containing protein [Acidobacteriota bacterium]
MSKSPIDIELLIRQAQSLHPLPQSVTRLAQMMSGEGWTMTEVVEAISYDQTLTVRLLAMANSAAFAAQNEIRTVRDAVVRLGAGAVLSLAMAATVQSHLDRGVPQYGLGEGDLWDHSVAAAVSVQALATRAKADLPAESFTAAVLHDIGKLLISRHLDANLLERLARARDEEGRCGFLAEVEVLGIHHGQLGAMMARSWGLPAEIVRGIEYHHDPLAGGGGVCHVVHVANGLAHMVIDTGPCSGHEPTPEPGSLEALGLTREDMTQLVTTVGDQLDEVLQRYAVH